MKVNNDTKFGFCRGCNKWVPRDLMVATNMLFYGDGADNIERLIRLRLCPECQYKYSPRWTQNDNGETMEWEGTLYEAREIRVRQDLADQCDHIDYDDSEAAMMGGNQSD